MTPKNYSIGKFKWKFHTPRTPNYRVRELASIIEKSIDCFSNKAIYVKCARDIIKKGYKKIPQ